jgi:hypothetical protein
MLRKGIDFLNRRNSRAGKMKAPQLYAVSVPVYRRLIGVFGAPDQ